MEAPKSPGVYKHIILAKLRDDVSKETFEEVAKDFAALPSLIRQMKSFHWGEHEGMKKNKGYTHIVEATFDSLEDIAIYYDHPAHVRVAVELLPLVEDYLVINYKPTSDLPENK